MKQCPEATALQAWEAVPLTPTVKLSPCAPRSPTAPLFGSHVPARPVHLGCGRWGGEVGWNEASHYSSISMSTSGSPPAESSSLWTISPFYALPSTSCSLSCARMARRCCPPTLQPQCSVCLCRQGCTMNSFLLSREYWHVGKEV